jgi:hypothetical protein
MKENTGPVADDGEPAVADLLGDGPAGRVPGAGSVEVAVAQHHALEVGRAEDLAFQVGCGRDGRSEALGPVGQQRFVLGGRADPGGVAEGDALGDDPADPGGDRRPEQVPGPLDAEPGGLGVGRGVASRARH